MKLRVASLAFTLWLCVIAPSAAQERVALFYSLPEDGVWVEYEWRSDEAKTDQRASTLRISSVGKATLQDKPCRWVEIYKVETRADQSHHQLRKLLVVENTGAAAKHAPFQVLAGFAQNGLGGPVRRLNSEATQKLVGLGFHDAENGLALLGVKEQIHSGLGHLQAKHVTARVKNDKRTLIYHSWLAREVPFGCAKFEIREVIGDGPERVLFTARAMKKGEAARSLLDDTKAPIAPGTRERGTRH